MNVLVLLGLIVAACVAIDVNQHCSQGCQRKHPQQHFCDATFAMKVKILKVDSMPELQLNLIEAAMKSSWKSEPEAARRFQFYNPSLVLCDANFEVGLTYVITGFEDSIKGPEQIWLVGKCDFVKKWDNLSLPQQKGFSGQYGDQCDTPCEITPVNSPFHIKVVDMETNDDPSAQTFWTSSGCYYNPMQTDLYTIKQSNVEDCEELYGICSSNDSHCSWQITSEYESCFSHRDNFVLAENGELTNPDDCRVFISRRKRRKCRKHAKKYGLK